MKVEHLKNLNPSAAIILSAIGITTAEQLRAMGSVEVYARIRKTGYKANIEMLYALEGALRNTRWHNLPHHVRRSLRISAGISLKNST